MKTKDLIPTEDQEQIVLAQWLDMHNINYFHVPNGGNRNIITATKLKSHGVKPGVPDIIIVDPPPNNPENVGLVIELKRRKGGKVSPEQTMWLDVFRTRGWIVSVCRGAGQAIDLLQELGYGRRVG